MIVSRHHHGGAEGARGGTGGEGRGGEALFCVIQSTEHRL